ncbi:putative membrane protein [Filibacter limicola]|uniref:Membrane protein n=2 Tax=Sporosarcina limicola TaxID=34101 RepID=A0A927R524_9BACL|nr:putative membrane protein [Sporosarcina limicola]
MKWFIGILVNAAIFLILSWLIPSFVVSSIGTAIIASIILAIVNMLVRPILIFFTLPATIVTLGFFIFVINAAMLLLTDKFMGDGFVIEGFGTALLIAILMSILNVMINSIILEPMRDKRK